MPVQLKTKRKRMLDHLSRFAIRFLLIPCGLSTSIAAVVEVDSPSSLARAVSAAQPGDEIVISDGLWRDSTVKIVGNGTKESPIYVRPVTPGGLTISGQSRIRIGGSHVIVSGFHVRNIRGVSDCLQFREDSKNLARHCRVTESLFDESPDFDPGKADARWIGIYGEHNQFDHCRLEGKKSPGATLVIWLKSGSKAQHHVHHNHFGFRQQLGRNGGETIRVGDSKTSHLPARCLIEENLFERCNGEAECISNKSCENTYRLNLFREVEGTLTLRHGHRCIVERNVFLGNDIKHTGGVRIIGGGHIIRSNYLSNLGGTKARGAIVLQSGIADSPANGYSPVVDAVIRDNHVIRCRESLVVGYADKDSPESVIAPKDCVLEGNRFLASARQDPIIEHRPAIDSYWNRNVATGRTLGIETPNEGLRFVPGDPDSSLILPIPKTVATVTGTSW